MLFHEILRKSITWLEKSGNSAAALTALISTGVDQVQPLVDSAMAQVITSFAQMALAIIIPVVLDFRLGLASVSQYLVYFVVLIYNTKVVM